MASRAVPGLEIEFEKGPEPPTENNADLDLPIDHAWNVIGVAPEFVSWIVQFPAAAPV